MSKALKLHILVNIDEIYARALKAKYLAYWNLSFLEVITNLKSNYHKITPVVIKENATCMTFAYNVNQSFEMVIGQIEMAVNFSDAGRVPYTPE